MGRQIGILIGRAALTCTLLLATAACGDGDKASTEATVDFGADTVTTSTTEATTTTTIPDPLATLALTSNRNYDYELDLLTFGFDQGLDDPGYTQLIPNGTAIVRNESSQPAPGAAFIVFATYELEQLDLSPGSSPTGANLLSTEFCPRGFGGGNATIDGVTYCAISYQLGRFSDLEAGGDGRGTFDGEGLHLVVREQQVKSAVEWLENPVHLRLSVIEDDGTATDGDWQSYREPSAKSELLLEESGSRSKNGQCDYGPFPFDAAAGDTLRITLELADGEAAPMWITNPAGDEIELGYDFKPREYEVTTSGTHQLRGTVGNSAGVCSGTPVRTFAVSVHVVR